MMLTPPPRHLFRRSLGMWQALQGPGKREPLGLREAPLLPPSLLQTVVAENAIHARPPAKGPHPIASLCEAGGSGATSRSWGWPRERRRTAMHGCQQWVCVAAGAKSTRRYFVATGRNRGHTNSSCNGTCTTASRQELRACSANLAWHPNGSCCGAHACEYSLGHMSTSVVRQLSA